MKYILIYARAALEQNAQLVGAIDFDIGHTFGSFCVEQIYSICEKNPIIEQKIGRAFGHDLIFLYIIVNRRQAECGVELARTRLRREGGKAAAGRLIVNLLSLCSFAQFEPAHCLFVDLVDQCANAFGCARKLLVWERARR